MSKAIKDTVTMSSRSLRLSFRNVEELGAITITPIMMVILFIYIFGSGADDVQAFTNGQTPSVIVFTLTIGAFFAAYSVHSDMHKGVIDRFRSMPLFQPSVLAGHVSSSIIRCLITFFVVLGITVLLGFRPHAGVLDWIIILGILFLTTIMVTWVSIFIGLIVNASESIASFALMVQIMPFLSTGFSVPDNFITPVRLFFTHQPFSPIINSIRGLTMGVANTGEIITAVAWCVVLTIVFYVLSMNVYSRKAR